MNSHSDYVALFRLIADTHTELAHDGNFFRITNAMGPLGQVLSIEEVTQAQANGTTIPFMILESYEYGYSDNLADQFFKVKEAAFIIMSMPQDKTDQDQVEQVFNYTEQICDDIVSWLKKYYAKPTVAVTGYLQIGSFVCEKVGPFGLGYYGTRCAFHMHDDATQTLKFDPTKWTANP